MGYSELSDDLALQVFSHVSQNDKLRLSRVCKPWRKLLAKPTTLWQSFSVYPPASRTPASLASLLRFLESRKACVRQLNFQREAYFHLELSRNIDIRADHALASLLCTVGQHLRQLTFESRIHLEVATMYSCLHVCPHLERVTIYQCGSHACGTEDLDCLQKLQFLEVHVEGEIDNEFVDVDTFCFPEHNGTLVLYLLNPNVDSLELCASLTGLSLLTCLHLFHCSGISYDLPLALLHLRSLESLHLQGFSLSRDWASGSSCMTKLTLLSFAGLYDPVPLHELADLPALQTLHMSGTCKPEHGDIVIDLDVLPELPPSVRELRICRLTWDPEMSSLRGLANLRVCMLHDTGSVSLPAHMPHLQTLVLDCNDGLVLEDHLTGFTALRLLSLRACGQVTVPSAFHQLAALPHLTCIDVEGSLPVNQVDWSAYVGLPLHAGDEPGSRPMDHRPHLVYDGIIAY